MRTGKNMLRLAILMLICGVLLTGCAAVFEVGIDSICAPEAKVKRTYILLSGLKDVDSSDLQFKEYARYVEKALAPMGFSKADTFENADVAIFLIYGIGDPQKHQYTYTLPVWGQTGVSSSTTYGRLSRDGSYYGTTTYIPTYGITGYTSQTGTYETYFRFFGLEAVDVEEYKRSQKVVQVWQTTVTSTGSSDDLRRVFPVLVAAAKQYIGTNTGKKVKVYIAENRKAVAEIRD